MWWIRLPCRQVRFRDRASVLGDLMNELLKSCFPSCLGKYLRRNAVARAMFIMYLLLLHSWAFILLFVHAHSFETLHGDFGAGVSVPHGPHALMQQQQVQIQPDVAQARQKIQPDAAKAQP
jgi:hypothetical protein